MAGKANAVRCMVGGRVSAGLFCVAQPGLGWSLV